MLRMLDVLMLVLSAACAFLLLCSYFSKSVDPNRAVFFAFPGLVFPILYICGLALMLYWIIRWKLWALVMAVVLLIGAGNIKLFYKFDLRERYDDNTPSRTGLVVMTYNVMGMSSSFDSEGEGVQRLISGFVNANNVDILCMQEFPVTESRNGEFIDALPDLRYRVTEEYGINNGIGIALFTRYPIVNHGTMDPVDDDIVRMVWADIKIQRDTVRVINIHLQSTNLSGNDVDYISRGRMITDPAEGKVMMIGRKLGANYRIRATQARMIARFVADSPHQTIVCGDFNDTPQSYVYRRIAKGMQDTFVEQGRGAHGTYSGFFNMFRIDYIFMSRGLNVTGHYNFEERYSDHSPVAASFEFHGL